MELKAIATEYDGIVFRSRLEAIFYRYIQIDIGRYNEPFGILYEPAEYKIKGWNPDFFVEHVGRFTCLVEVKPSREKLKVLNYVKAFDHFDIDMVVTCCPDVMFLIHKNGKISYSLVNDVFYKQASNDVYHYLKLHE